MEKRESSVKILNIIICALLLVAFVLFLGIKKVNAEVIAKEENMVLPSVSTKIGETYRELIKDTLTKEVPEIKEKQIVYDLDYYLDVNKDTIAFMAKVFDYNLDDIIYDLKTREKNNPVFLSTNIGYLKDENGNLKVYDSFEYGLIEYFYDLIDHGTITRHVNYEPYAGEATYVENLIMYFSKIYNIDASTLLSIGAAESGYYEVKFMLSYNNIFGGMGYNGLIRYNNIEYGVLSYVRLLANNYYAKGLNTIESIGYVYCPSYEYGYKSASSHWLSLVYKAKSKYDAYVNNITINNLINKTEIA